MEKIVLPKDVKRYAIFTVLKRVIPCVLLLVLFCLILFFLGERIFNMDIKEVKISCYIVTMLLPFVITGVPIKLIDSTYCGEIKKVDIKTTIDADIYGKNLKTKYLPKNEIYLFIALSNGKIIKRKVKRGDPKADIIEDYYKEGDRVFHLYGSPCTIVLPQDKDEIVSCPICGYSSDIEADTCQTCGHTLIKIMK